MSTPKTLSSSHLKVTLSGQYAGYGIVENYSTSYSNYNLQAAIFGPASYKFTVTNTGTINAVGPQYYGIGILLGQAGTINNAGHIAGGVGIEIRGASGTAYIKNTGDILGQGNSFGFGYPIHYENGVGILSTANAEITNQGSIGATAIGIALIRPGNSNDSNSGTVTNAGTISAAGDVGVLVGQGTISNTGEIYGYSAGVVLGNPEIDYDQNPDTYPFANTTIASTLINNGQIAVHAPANPYDLSNGVVLDGNTTLINQSNGTISDLSGRGVSLYALVGQFSTVAHNYNIYAYALTGALTNNGLIQGMYGARFSGLGVVINTGTIAGQNTGLLVSEPQDVTYAANAPKVQVYNSGLITASGTSFSYYGTTLTTTASALLMTANGTITNATGGTIAAPDAEALVMTGGGGVSNAGLITAGSTGIVLENGGLIDNSGSVYGASVGIDVTQGGTVVDSGFIGGGVRYAIYFNAGSAANSRLILTATASFGGTIQLNGGALNFAADGSTVGTFAPENLQIINAGSITIDTGAILDIAGTFTNGSTGTLVNDGTIKESAHDLIDFNGPITGTGLIELSKKPLTFNNAVAAGQKISFSGTGETLDLGDPKAFKGKIENFKLGDTIDLTGIKLSAITAPHFVGGVLTLSEGSTKLEFTFANPASFGTDKFKLKAAGHGTIITLAAAAALLPVTHVTTLVPLPTLGS